MSPQATEEDVRSVEQEIESIGLRPFMNPGVQRRVIAVLGEVDVKKADLQEHFQAFTHVERVDIISELWKLASRTYHPENTVVDINGVKVGGPTIVIGAGPCSVESYEQTRTIADHCKQSGAKLFRGGAFKPRSSPYS